GATVSITGGGSTTSSTTGAYTLSNVTAGTQTLTASATGYLTRTFSVPVTGGSTTTQNAPLSTAGKIKGSVTNASNNTAISGATVTISGGQIPTSNSVNTDASGNYDEGWVPVTTSSSLYTVTCKANGFNSQTVSNQAVTAGNTTTVNCSLSA